MMFCVFWTDFSLKIFWCSILFKRHLKDLELPKPEFLRLYWIHNLSDVHDVHKFWHCQNTVVSMFCDFWTDFSLNFLRLSCEEMIFCQAGNDNNFQCIDQIWWGQGGSCPLTFLPNYVLPNYVFWTWCLKSLFMLQWFLSHKGSF